MIVIIFTFKDVSHRFMYEFIYIFMYLFICLFIYSFSCYFYTGILKVDYLKKYGFYDNFQIFAVSLGMVMNRVVNLKGAARYSEGSLIRRFVPNTHISYAWKFVNPKMK